jgi:quaternary ammonium compound-resistance protein SugE
MAVRLGPPGLTPRSLPRGPARAIRTKGGRIGTAILGIVLSGEPAGALRPACIGRSLAAIPGRRVASGQRRRRVASGQ